MVPQATCNMVCLRAARMPGGWEGDAVAAPQIAYYQIFLEIPTAYSLKEKRGFLKGPLERIRKKLNAAIIEADEQDTWNRATVAAVTLSTSESVLNKTRALILKELEDAEGLVLKDWTEERL